MFKKVIFGKMEFGNFEKQGDLFPCAIIHNIDEVCWLKEEDIDNYMVDTLRDGFIVPEDYKGDVFYSKTFMKGLAT